MSSMIVHTRLYRFLDLCDVCCSLQFHPHVLCVCPVLSRAGALHPAYHYLLWFLDVHPSTQHSPHTLHFALELVQLSFLSIVLALLIALTTASRFRLSFLV